MNRTTRETLDLYVHAPEKRGGMGGLFGFLDLAGQIVLFVLNVVATFLFLLAVGLICFTIMFVMARCSPKPTIPPPPPTPTRSQTTHLTVGSPGPPIVREWPPHNHSPATNDAMGGGQADDADRPIHRALTPLQRNLRRNPNGAVGL